MKITKSKLKQIIKEELEAVLEPGYEDSYSNFSKILKNDVQNVLFSLEAASEVSPRRRKS